MSMRLRDSARIKPVLAVFRNGLLFRRRPVCHDLDRGGRQTTYLSSKPFPTDEPVMRPVIMFLAVFALILALVPGPRAFAGAMDARVGTTICIQHEADGCAPAMTDHAKPGKHGFGSCNTAHCCLGAACVFAGLPPTVALVVRNSTTERGLSGLAAALAGRDVAPPFDPPKSFA